ncbi:MAG: IS1595 family transposase [Desulfocapsa sp.]|nr:IS1595 family transposase [Desulfocapsa sp.]
MRTYSLLLTSPLIKEENIPKNKIQLQKGMRLHDFNKFYGANEQCEAVLHHFRRPHGFVYPKCGHERLSKLKSRPPYQCRQCRYQASVIYMRLSRIKSFSTFEIERWSEKHLRNQNIVVSNGLYCFNGVKHAGFSHESVVTGGGYESVKIPVFKWINVMPGNVKCSLHGTYHSISKKHAPRYLAEFCYQFNRRFRMGSKVPSLAYAAINFS